MEASNDDIARILNEGIDPAYCKLCAAASQRRMNHYANKADAAPSIVEATKYRKAAQHERGRVAYWTMMEHLAAQYTKGETA